MISLQRIGTGYYNPNRKEYLIDSAADIANLPTSTQESTLASVKGTCAPGSLAYTPDLVNAWMLGNDDVWHAIASEGAEA